MKSNSMSSFSSNEFNKEVYKIISKENKMYEQEYIKSLSNTDYLQHSFELKGIDFNSLILLIHSLGLSTILQVSSKPVPAIIL